MLMDDDASLAMKGLGILAAVLFVVNVGQCGFNEAFHGNLSQRCYPNSTCQRGLVCYTDQSDHGPRKTCVPENPKQDMK